MTRNYAVIAADESIEKARRGLEKRGFKVKVFDTLAEARDEVLATIPDGSEVFTATSVTLNEAGLTEELNESGRYVSVRKKFAPLAGDKDKAVEMRRIGSGSDYTVGSIHAITEDGEVLIASASGSQLPNYVYGAAHVIWVVGAQKIVRDFNAAMDRIESYTLGLEDVRAKEAYGSGSVLSKLLVYRQDHTHRITVIIVKEAVGY